MEVVLVVNKRVADLHEKEMQKDYKKMEEGKRKMGFFYSN